MKRFATMLLICLLITCTAIATADETAFEPFFRVDIDDVEAWEKPLINLRFLTAGTYSFTALDEKYGVSPDTVPSTEGLDTLNISGSAEFSEDQFRQLAADIRALAGDRRVDVVDCRLEDHGLLNGISVSWYGSNNWANEGMTLDEAEADEAERFGSLPGTTVTAYTVKDNSRGDALEIPVERWMTERELVESEGFGYIRLPALDHSWPEPEAVDRFIEFAKDLDMDNTWLHFHCQAGQSRTGIFMAIYDMMKNPGVSFEDIALRHAMTGSSYLPYVNTASEMADVYAKRAEGFRLIYDYVQENRDSGYATPWSEWADGKMRE